MAETRRADERPELDRAPAAPDLLRAALEKVVFFEWRLGEMAAELAAAQSRATAAELERARVAAQRSEAEREAEAAREHVHALEAERERLSSLLARPARAAAENASAQTERLRVAELTAELAEARREIDRQRAERDRWLDERLSQALGAGDGEGSLAAFISELRGEVIALREAQKRSDELLRDAGIAPPAPPSRPPPPVTARDALAEARILLSQGPLSAPGDLAAAARGAALAASARVSASAARPGGSAASALTEQCLRGIVARDPRRREQAARHLAAVPAPAAAPSLAAALGVESDPRARGQIAVALVACGGPMAADLVVALQSDAEPLVRLAALEALCSIPDRAIAALETAFRDAAPAVRRRAAALSSSLGLEEMRGKFAMDADASVRAAAAPREEPAPVEVPARAAPVRAVPAPPRPAARNLAQDAVLAVQTAIFGLTEAELAEALSLPAAETGALVATLVSDGRLARRGKRLVAAAAPGAAAQGGP